MLDHFVIFGSGMLSFRLIILLSSTENVFLEERKLFLSNLTSIWIDERLQQISFFNQYK